MVNNVVLKAAGFSAVPRLSLYYEEGSKHLQHLAINTLRELLTVSHLRGGISSVDRALEMKVIPIYNALQTARNSRGSDDQVNWRSRPVSIWRPNNFLNKYFRAKYIDAQIN